MAKPFITLILLISIVGKVFAEPIVWKIQSSKPINTSLLSIERKMMREIEKESNGELRFDLRAGKGYFGHREAYSALRTGKLDAILMSPAYWSSADPVFAIMGDLVAAWNNPSQYLMWLQESNGIDYLKRAYERANLKLLGYTVAPSESLVSTKPIAKVADFKGMVMRAPPGMIDDFFQLLGVRTRNIVVHQVSDALRRGQINLADLTDIAANNQAKIYTLAKHTNYPGFHSMPLYDFVANNDSWQALSKKHQNIVLKAISRWQNTSYQQAKIEQEIAVKQVIDQNVTLYHWSTQELQLARRQAIKVWDKYAQKSPEAFKLISELKKWLQSQGNIE